MPLFVVERQHPVCMVLALDRKSTRLNSSHSQISYAVFCLDETTTPPEPAPGPTPDDTAVEQRVARMLVLAKQTAAPAVHEAQVEADRTRGNSRFFKERVLSEARSLSPEEIVPL